jgi:hypothetical protein
MEYARTHPQARQRPAVTWHVHYAGVRVGVIVERSGAPPTLDQWQWCCGFYPGSDPGDDRHGTAADFETARAAFEAAWREYLPKRTDADFEEWRQDAAWHTAKYHEAGKLTLQRLVEKHKPSDSLRVASIG